MKCTHCNNEAASWSHVCTTCYKTAYKVFDKYGYKNIPHSGGCCRLIEVNSELTQEDNDFVVEWGWKNNGSYYSSPWDSGFDKSNCRYTTHDNMTIFYPRFLGPECKICGKERACQSDCCVECAGQAYQVFEKYGYEHIPHSGGPGDLIALKRDLTPEDREFILGHGWIDDPALLKDGKTFWGPMIHEHRKYL